MEQKNRPASLRRRTLCQAAATTGFLLTAGLLLYACAALTGNVLREEMVKKDPGTHATQTPPGSPAPTVPATSKEPIQDAAAIRVYQTPAPQAGTPVDTPDAAAVPSDMLTPSASPSPTPAPTLLPLCSAKPFSASRAEFVLLGLDDNDNPDWIVIAQMRDEACRVLSVPRNTLYGNGQPLAGSLGANQTRRRLTEIWPVSYPYYVNLTLSQLPQSVDTLGGITLDGTLYTGKQVGGYLENAGSDELLRIARQQDVMRAILNTLRETGYLTLLASKFKLEQAVWSNLSTLQLLAVFQYFKNIPKDNITFATLPVDSVTREGVRCYTPDIGAINRLLANP